jgi:phosphoesterase RecJ-like protein
MPKTAADAEIFLATLRGASSVLISTHLNPDGDALGSSLGLAFFLDSLGIKCDVVCHHAPPRNLLFLPGIERVKTVAEGPYDLGVMLDLGVLDRLGSIQEPMSAISKVMVVDHHLPHEEPGNVRIIDTSAPATATILTRLLLAAGAEIGPEMATCLLTGIVTDTGSFRFRNTTPEALAQSATLLERGADLNLVNEEVFRTKPLASVRLLGIALQHLQIAREGRLGWSVLTSRDFQEAEAKDEDTEGFVNEILSIDTVQIAVLLREPNPGKIRCSIRSRGHLDVAAIAREFGGGGHMNAAGCTFDSSMAEAVDALIARLKACWE